MASHISKALKPKKTESSKILTEIQSCDRDETSRNTANLEYQKQLSNENSRFIGVHVMLVYQRLNKIKRIFSDLLYPMKSKIIMILLQ